MTLRATPSFTCTSSAQVSGQSCGHAPLTFVTLGSSGRRITRYPFENPVHESLALCELLERDEFIRPMRLRDVARTANDRGHSHLLKQARFGAVGHLARSVWSSRVAWPIARWRRFPRRPAPRLADPFQVDAGLRDRPPASRAPAPAHGLEFPGRGPRARRAAECACRIETRSPWA